MSWLGSIEAVIQGWYMSHPYHITRGHNGKHVTCSTSTHPLTQAVNDSHYQLARLFTHALAYHIKLNFNQIKYLPITWNMYSSKHYNFIVTQSLPDRTLIPKWVG